MFLIVNRYWMNYLNIARLIPCDDDDDDRFHSSKDIRVCLRLLDHFISVNKLK